MGTVIEDATSDLENIAELIEEAAPNRRIFPRSHSCPSIMQSVTSARMADGDPEDAEMLSTSPRTAVRAFQQKQAPISSSYKELSVLEQRLLQEENLGILPKDNDALSAGNVQETVTQEGSGKSQEESFNKNRTEVISQAAAAPSAKFLAPPDTFQETSDQTRPHGGQKKPRPVSLPPQTDSEDLQMDKKKQAYLGVESLKGQQGAELHAMGRPRGHTVASMESTASREDYTGRRRRTSENRPRALNRTGLSPR